MRLAFLALALCLAFPVAHAHDDDDSRDGRDGRDGQSISHVNRGITAEAGRRYGGLETVNGGIHAGRDVQVARGAETVNGGIRFEFGSSVGGDITTVNGGITIKQTRVQGRIETVQGDIIVGNGSVVQGGILVTKPQGIRWGRNRTPRIVIGPNATVNGALRFEREVELFVHPSAKIGAVTGATVQRYTDSLPPRRND